MIMLAQRKRAPRNRTILLSKSEVANYKKKLLILNSSRASIKNILNKTIKGDFFEVIEFLPNSFADLIFADPPYNLTKNFNGQLFQKKNEEQYEEWLESWVQSLKRILNPRGSIYICCDWRSSAAVYRVGKRHFIPRNRITWEREKGRGARNNWKNCIEDIWFFTKSDKYYFDLESVKIKKKVIAPYVNSHGEPKDWSKTGNGNYRNTCPSNIWTDLTIPFWSMPENTDHPTQKPEKLLAKIILAATKKGDVVFDPFLGSGTTSVTAKKLNRNYVGIESDEMYCCLTEKRLHTAEDNPNIQGYLDNTFWERNSMF